MGLLDDPSQLAAIVGLLQGRQPAGGLLMQYADSIEQRKRAAQQEQMQKLQQEHMQMQMAQQKEMMARQQQEQALAGQFARPGMPERPQMGPTPDGSPMPMAPAQAPGFDYQGYAGALAGVDPMKALALQSQLAGMGQKESFTLKPGERRYQGDKVVAEGGPESVKPGTLKEIKSGPNTITYEWSGSKWDKVATAPTHAPDKPAAPQLYESPNGPMWIQPPSRGSGAQPAMGPDGQPLAAKLPDSAKKELMTLDQELASIKGAQQAAKANQSAFGFKRGAATLAGAIPESMAGRMDTKDEKEARAYVFNVVSKAINERAGAAQSAQELARLRSFLPAETDSAAQVDAKLNGYTKYLTDRRNAVTSGAIQQPAAPTADNDPLRIRGK